MVRTLLLTLCSLFLLACSSNKPAPTTPFNVTVQVDVAADVNRYGNGDPHPVVLRLYQLTESGRFKSAEFLDLYNRDKEVLGAAMVDVLSLDPLAEGQHKIKIDLQRQSRYLAVFAEFANYTEANSKAVIQLDEEPEDQVLMIRVSGLSVAVGQQPAKAWWQIF